MQNTISEGQRPQELDNNAKAAESLPQSMNSDISLQKQSYFKNIQLTPINGSANIVIDTSQQQTTFEIPISCWNPYWTVLSFKFKCAANTNYEFIPNTYCPYFNRAELWTASGNVYLANIQACDVYSRLACPLNNDFRYRSEEEGPNSVSKRVEWSRSTIADYSILSQSDPQICLLNNNSSVVGLLSDSPNQQGNSVTSITINAVMDERVYSFRLGDIFPDSFFNLNNSFYLSKVLYLRLTWNTKDYIYYSLVGTNALPTVITVTPGASSINIDQINLQCRIEGDEAMINAKKMLTQTPSTILVPYVYNWSQSMSGGGTMQTSFTLASDGSKIMRLFRLYSGISRSGGNIKIDFNNIGGTTITSQNAELLLPGIYSRIQLYINGILIEQQNVTPTSLNMMLKQIKEYFPNCSLVTSKDVLAYGGYATQFNTEQQPEEKINLYSNQIGKGLDASKSNLAINIQYDTTGSSGVGGLPFTGQGSLYLFPVVFKSFTYVNGSFEYA